ncbi:phosphatidylserine/phosphatidylglycerophosphate/cardiolipin synthase family protein [candidate division KSB1 bacterium]|nr:phosphatidylserine/phosphatidylglycerophosphate/cardiolipin synthase family protein [candidate division KSB1 bacterium]
MNIEILVDSENFFNRLKKDIQQAHSNIYVQAMTFEGDKAGKELCQIMESSPTQDKRVLIDSYIKAIINDRFLYAPKNLFDTELRNEVKETNALIDHINNNGIRAKLINPLGPLLIHFAFRNHKKMVLIDDRITYVGGLNFSDHNYAWHDMMIRIENTDIALFMKQDFLSTWHGVNQNVKKSFEKIDFYICDGKSNDLMFNSIFELIDSAKHSIYIESPYISFPFYDKLRRAGERGVAVNLLTPGNNNKPFMQKYTYWEARRSNINLRLYTGQMSHLKAILIDDKHLVVGSSNFDCLSYQAQQEIVVVVHDPDIINQFKNKILLPDWEQSIHWTGKTSSVFGYFRYLQIKSICSLICKLPRN